MGKGFPCPWNEKVICPHRKSSKFSILSQCHGCVHLKKFEREMEEEEDAVFEEIELIEKHGYAYVDDLKRKGLFGKRKD